MTEQRFLETRDVPKGRHAFFYKRELAEYLGVSTRTVDRLDAAGRLPEPCRIGGKKGWLRTEVEAWVTAHCPARQPAPARKKSGE